ncbi:hypothetical protein AGDE_01619 [Angomonas deanei]|uniref:Uncharacterized protein n=1 Tax=Angomonas deanei TaxID=59799 RepID=S9VNA0_9TRYP|nr:hypothetical protein AGDE_08276 [Angomonas deanei]EPY41470.1 hypothetical protein AGDE_02454 [Angomonas deanei]EPY42304.1 hypothetical protein AGDE_01619 [Angomonas deanei]CAD2220998.1 hypothetical protein, conserved [Angomonas deanei]|eukprot:EPY33453.1 hypothetical protein AGDE_08276 [Angomonas deanei]
MVRYVQRPWYSPLGFMASAPTSYVPLMVVTSLALIFPMRYRLSEYFERQKNGPHIENRQKAVKYYNELERMHRRQAMQNLENMQNDNSGHRNSVRLAEGGIRFGMVDDEMQYWRNYQSDALRAEKLLAEIRELKSKMASEEKQKK